MTRRSLRKRVAVLEAEVAKLRADARRPAAVTGLFSGDQLRDELRMARISGGQIFLGGRC